MRPVGPGPTWQSRLEGGRQCGTTAADPYGWFWRRIIFPDINNSPGTLQRILVVSFFVPAAHRNLLSTCAPFVVMAFSVPVACRYLFSTDGYSVQNFVHWTRLRILPCLPICGPIYLFVTAVFVFLICTYVHLVFSHLTAIKYLDLTMLLLRIDVATLFPRNWTSNGQKLRVYGTTMYRFIEDYGWQDCPGFFCTLFVDLWYCICGAPLYEKSMLMIETTTICVRNVRMVSFLVTFSTNTSVTDSRFVNMTSYTTSINPRG